MVRIELNPKLKTPVTIGVCIFVIEFIFGLSNIISGYIPMIFVMALVIGYLTTSIEDGIFALVIALVIGNIIGGLIMAVVLFPAWLGPGNIDLVSLGIIFFITPFIAMSGSISVLNGFAMDETILLVFLFGPGLYFFSPAFSFIGVKIRKRLGKESTAPDIESKNDASEEIEQEEIVLGNNSTN